MNNANEQPQYKEALLEDLRVNAERTVQSILQNAGLKEVIVETKIEDGKSKATSWENTLTVIFKTESMKPGDSLWIISIDEYDKPEKESRLRELVQDSLETISERARIRK